jgi:flagellar hook-basal body complex protein FliE
MTTALTAANSYANMAKLANQTTQTSKPSNNLVSDFADLVSENVQGMVEQGKTADAQTMNLAAGKANMIDVVTAVAETEVALETMVSMRDKVISAYEEIMRMPI